MWKLVIGLLAVGTCAAQYTNRNNERLLNETMFKSTKDGSLNRTMAKQLVKDMFFHGWNGYLEYAYPQDDLAPISCTGRSTHGDYMVSLIDTADTLAILGEYEQFAHAVQLISNINDFKIDKESTPCGS